MFALTKLCDRPDAIAFPHAFILTVQIVDPKNQTTEKMGNTLTKVDVEKSVKSSLEKEFSLDRLSTGNLPNDKEIIDVESTNGHQEKDKENKNKESSWFFCTRSRLKESDENHREINSAEK